MLHETSAYIVRPENTMNTKIKTIMENTCGTNEAKKTNWFNSWECMRIFNEAYKQSVQVASCCELFWHLQVVDWH